eukprot:1815911-Karenia_brevis.AAC.1
MSFKRTVAASAIASESPDDAWPALACAHIVFAISSDSAIASKAPCDAWPTVSTAHPVFASP